MSLAKLIFGDVSKWRKRLDLNLNVFPQREDDDMMMLQAENTNLRGSG